MQPLEYHKRIVDYYHSTENAYKDSWDLDNSLAIHYGYWDEQVNSFPGSLQRMNEVMAAAANIKSGENVLDAGCGVGGSSVFLALHADVNVTGITLSERQAEQARKNAERKNAADRTDFRVMNYCATEFPENSFDVVWGCESICYADSKEKFIQEAWRLLRPGGRLIIADGFVTSFDNNDHPLIRQWLNGWEVNYLETPGRFQEFMKQAGFDDVQYWDISKYTAHSVRRLYRFYFLASLYLAWKKMSFSKRANAMQRGNIAACKYQYLARKKNLWEYGMVVGRKP